MSEGEGKGPPRTVFDPGRRAAPAPAGADGRTRFSPARRPPAEAPPAEGRTRLSPGRAAAGERLAAPAGTVFVPGGRVRTAAAPPCGPPAEPAAAAPRRRVLALAGLAAAIVGVAAAAVVALLPGAPPTRVAGPDPATLVEDPDAPTPTSFVDFARADIIALPGDPVTIDRVDAGRSAVRLLPDARAPAAAGDAPVYALSVRLTALPAIRTDVAGEESAFRFSGIGSAAPAAGPEAWAAGWSAEGTADEGPAGRLAGAADAGASVTLRVDRAAAGADGRTVERIVRRPESRTLAGVLQDLAMSADARAVADAFAALFNAGAVGPDALLAVRFRQRETASGVTRLPLQVSLYEGRGYVGTVARADDGTYQVAVDPWAGRDLFAEADAPAAAPADGPRPRVLDAVYHVALASGVPSGTVGETLFHLSRVADLSRPLADGDRLDLLFTADPRDPGAGVGRVIYAALAGPSGHVTCPVVRTGGAPAFGCAGLSPDAAPATPEATRPPLTMRGGMVVPVRGALTSRFNPRRKHPITGRVRPHNGVDWGAPRGTPVVAAFDGKVTVAGWGGGYGNVVYIGHSDGVQTRYAHLARFGEGVAAGRAVRAGELIGFVGTTGLSTGPHLHFEVRVSGTPVDPLTATVEVDRLPGAPAPVATAGGAPPDPAAELSAIRELKLSAGLG